MAAKFEIKKSDKNEQFYFVLKADNGEVICQSEGYASQQACLDGIESVKQHAASSPVLLPTAL